MKIAHIDFTGTFNEEMTYQESILAEENALDGNSVIVITTCYRWNEKGEIVKVKEERKKLDKGYILIRMPYKKYINNAITNKIRDVEKRKLYYILDEFKPDIIILHCLQTFAINYIAKYCKEKKIRFVCDTHTNYFNSAKNIMSKYILHKVIYKKWIKNNYKNIDKIYYIGYEEKHFFNTIYNIKDEKMEYLPLGGKILPDEIRMRLRYEFRKKNNILNNEILFIAAGKFDKNKRLDVIIRCFISAKTDSKLIIAGSIDNYTKKLIGNNIDNGKIIYIGFVKGNELINILCACDIYLQPFAISAIAENAICAGCALILKNTLSYQEMVKENGFLINDNDSEELISCMKKISDNNILKKMKKKSLEIAKQKYDYKIIAKKIIS